MESKGSLLFSQQPATDPYHPVHTFPPISLIYILLLSYHLRLCLPSGLFPSCFPTKTLYEFLICPMRATCPTHLILLDLITPIAFGETYKFWSPSYVDVFKLPIFFLIRPSSLKISSNTDSLSRPVVIQHQFLQFYVVMRKPTRARAHAHTWWKSKLMWCASEVSIWFYGTYLWFVIFDCVDQETNL
jgi:hypothetical protein